MTETPNPPSAKPPRKGPVTREDRLKAALKANMAKRKAQTRARSAEAAQDDNNDND